MSMQYVDLARLKVEIHTTNDRNFLELAILFDKPEFLAYLPKIRAKYGFEPTTPDQYRAIQEKLEQSEETKFDFSSYDNPHELIDFVNDNAVWGNDVEHELTDNYKHLITDTNILCYLFHRPPNFADAIEEAILGGDVDGDIFKSTSFAVIENDMISSTPGYFQLPQAAILITPTSTDNDIKEQAQKIRGMYQSDNRLSYYMPRIDKVNKIRAYREWYWQHLAGKTYAQISSDWMENSNDPSDSGSDENRVLKGVAHYKKLLLI